MTPRDRNDATGDQRPHRIARERDGRVLDRLRAVRRPTGPGGRATESGADTGVDDSRPNGPGDPHDVRRFSAAAAGLPPVSAADAVSAADPVSAAFDRLAGVGVVDGYSREADSGPESAAGNATILVSDCALTARDGRFPTLPLVLELYRRTEPGRRHDAVRISSADDGWRVRLSAGSGEGSVGLASATIRS